MIEKGKFLLKDITYTITNSIAGISKEEENINLVFDIVAETEDENVEYEMSRLSLYHNDGFCTYTKNIQDLKGRKFVWEEPYNEDDEAAGFLCVQEHEEITKSIIEILNVDGNILTVYWSGEANVFWDEKYGDNVPFETVFDVSLPQIKYKIDVTKSLTAVIDKDITIKLNKDDLEALNNELIHYSEQQEKDWNTELNIDTVLRFTVMHNGKEYEGSVTFIEGKLKHKTDLDDKCPVKVVFDNFEWNFRVNLENFWFTVEM